MLSVAFSDAFMVASYEKSASYQSFMSFACLCVLVKVNMELGFVFLRAFSSRTIQCECVLSECIS